MLPQFLPKIGQHRLFCLAPWPFVRYELRQEQPLGTDAENNWFSMQSALKVCWVGKNVADFGRILCEFQPRVIEIQ